MEIAEVSIFMNLKYSKRTVNNNNKKKLYGYSYGVVFNEGISKNKFMELHAKSIPPLNICFTAVNKGAITQKNS